MTKLSYKWIRSDANPKKPWVCAACSFDPFLIEPWFTDGPGDDYTFCSGEPPEQDTVWRHIEWDHVPAEYDDPIVVLMPSGWKPEDADA